MSQHESSPSPHLAGREMPVFHSVEDLNRYRQEALQRRLEETQRGLIQIIICLGSCSIAAGALQTLQAFQQLLTAKGVQRVRLWKTGCNGQCHAEPLVWVVLPGQRKVAYANVTPERAARIIDEHILGGKIVQDYVLE